MRQGPFGLEKVMGDPTMNYVDPCHNVKQFVLAAKVTNILIQCPPFVMGDLLKQFALAAQAISSTLLLRLKVTQTPVSGFLCV